MVRNNVNDIVITISRVYELNTGDEVYRNEDDGYDLRAGEYYALVCETGNKSEFNEFDEYDIIPVIHPIDELRIKTFQNHPCLVLSPQSDITESIYRYGSPVGVITKR